MRGRVSSFSLTGRHCQCGCPPSAVLMEVNPLPPLVLSTTFPPQAVGQSERWEEPFSLPYCRDAYEENVLRCFILPPEQGEVRRSRIGGGERSEPISRMLIIPYDTESQSRNADFNKLAAKPPPPPFEPSEPFEPFEPSHRRCVQCHHHPLSSLLSQTGAYVIK